jgi:hypothetical protein
MDHLPQRSPEALMKTRDGARKGRSMPANLREQADEGTMALWRTPKATDADRGPHSEKAMRKRIENGKTIRLQDQVNHPRLFRTPDAECGRGAQSPERFAESVMEGRPLSLNDQVAHLWPTPKASDAISSNTSRTNRNGKTLPLEKSTHLTTRACLADMFPTPRAVDADKGQRTPLGAEKEANRGHGMDLPAHVRIFPTPTCNDAKNNNPPSQRTENGRHTDQLNVVAGGSLNPDWVEWLQGLPVGWTAIGG